MWNLCTKRTFDPVFVKLVVDETGYVYLKYTVVTMDRLLETRRATREKEVVLSKGTLHTPKDPRKRPDVCVGVYEKYGGTEVRLFPNKSLEDIVAERTLL